MPITDTAIVCATSAVFAIALVIIEQLILYFNLLPSIQQSILMSTFLMSGVLGGFFIFSFVKILIQLMKVVR